MEAAFNIGDQVQTLLGNGVKTIRTGFVVVRFFHVKESTMMYHLQINGKTYKKRYRETELQLIASSEPTSD